MVERTAVFQVAGVGQPGHKLFGVWSTSAAEELDVGPVWRVDLSGDAHDDSATLNAADAALGRSAQAVGAAGPRLDAALRQTGEHMTYGTGGLAEPEASLNALLTDAEDVSYGLGRPSWAGLTDEFRAVLQTAGRMLAYPAWIELSTAGQPAGRTIVTWGGDQTSVWGLGAGEAQVRAQQRALDLAISSRTTFIRMVGVAARGAAVLMAAATPLGPVLAFPAAWRFVDAVVREFTVTQARR